MHVAKKYLLLIAGIVWAAAGFNIVRIGWLSTSYMSIATAAAAVVTFLIFYHMIFKKLIHKLKHSRFSKQQHKLFCMLDSHGHDTAVQRLLLCMACICFFHSDTSAVKCCRFFFFYVCFLCILLGICISFRYFVTVLRDTLISIVLSLMTSC